MNATSDLHVEVYIGHDRQYSLNIDSVLVFVVVVSNPNSITIMELSVSSTATHTAFHSGHPIRNYLTP